jgi:hypothetical protein
MYDTLREKGVEGGNKNFAVMYADRDLNNERTVTVFAMSQLAGRKN